MAKRKRSVSSWDTSDDDSVYSDAPRKRRVRTTKQTKVKREDQEDDLSAEEYAKQWTPLSALEEKLGPETFEDVIQEMLGSLLETRAELLRTQVEVNHLNQKLRPLTISEENYFLSELRMGYPSRPNGPSLVERILIRKLELSKQRRRLSLPAPHFDTQSLSETLRAPDAPPPAQPPPDRAVLEALEAIGTTPFACSLAARIAGVHDGDYDAGSGSGLASRRYLHRDWETRAPWMDLMDDVHEHHALMHPERPQTSRLTPPIDYETLRPAHIPQVHDLLWRAFWPGIDISDSLQYSPEQCTVVVTYKRLVVGAAFLSSPQETYITFLVVRTGWESAQIATKMLHSLIERNPGRDILLHVSANNPAMLLYNRFGFKAEEFIVGFYEDYLDPQSRTSKNAFRLRLRA